MAKDLEFTAEVAVDFSKAARKDEALQKLIDAWNSKNAKAAKRVGTFGFMAAALAACGGGSGSSGLDGEESPGEGLIEQSAVTFRLLTGSASEIVIQTLNVDLETAKEDTLDVQDLLDDPDVSIDASAGLVIPAGQTFVGDISLFNATGGQGIEVSGEGSLWLLAPAGGFDDDEQSVKLNIELDGGILTFDMESDVFTVVIDDGSSVDLNGGTLQISDGTVLVSAAEYATWNVGELIVNSTLVIDFRNTALSEGEASALIANLDAATDEGNTASALRILVEDDAQADLVFKALEANTVLASGTAPKIELEAADGTSVVVNLGAIVDSKVEFLAASLESTIDALVAQIQGFADAEDYTSLALILDDSAEHSGTPTTNSIAGLQSAISSLNAGGDPDLDALEDRVGLTAAENNGTATGLYALIESSVKDAVESLEDTLSGYTRDQATGDLIIGSEDFASIKDLSDAVNNLQVLAGLDELAGSGANATDFATRLTDLETTTSQAIKDYVSGEIAALNEEIQGFADSGDYTTLKALQDKITELDADISTLSSGGNVDLFNLETSLNTLITEILAGPGLALTVDEATDLPNQQLGEELVANYRLVDTAAKIADITEPNDPILANAKAVIVNDIVTLSPTQVTALIARAVDWSASSYSLSGTADELVGLPPVVLGGATDINATGDVSFAQANTFMSASNGGTTNLENLVVNAAEARSIQFDSNDVVDTVTIAGSFVDDNIDLRHFPLGTEVVFSGRAGGETVQLPEGNSSSSELTINLSTGAGDDNLVFYGGPQSGDNLKVDGTLSFGAGDNVLKLIGTVDMSEVVVTSTILRFADLADPGTPHANDGNFVFSFDGVEYTANLDTSGDSEAGVPLVQAAIDAAENDNGEALGGEKIAVTFDEGDLVFTSLDPGAPFDTPARFQETGTEDVFFGLGNFRVVALTGSDSAVTLSPQAMSLITALDGDGSTTLKVQQTGEQREVVDLSGLLLPGVEAITVGNNVTAAVTLEQASRTTVEKSEESASGVGDEGRLVGKLQGTLFGDVDLTDGTFDEILSATGEVDGAEIFLQSDEAGEVTIPLGTTLTANPGQLNGVAVNGAGEANKGTLILTGVANENDDLSGIDDLTVILDGADLSAVTDLNKFFGSDVTLSPKQGTTMTLTADQATGRTIDADNSTVVIVGAVAETLYDFSNIMAQNAGAVFIRYESGEPLNIDTKFVDTQTVEVTAEMVDDLEDYTELNKASTVIVSAFHETPAANISGIEADLVIDLKDQSAQLESGAVLPNTGTATIRSDGNDRTLDVSAVTSLPGAFSVDTGTELVLTAEQANDFLVTGDGQTRITDLANNSYDFEDILTAGGLIIEAGFDGENLVEPALGNIALPAGVPIVPISFEASSLVVDSTLTAPGDSSTDTVLTLDASSIGEAASALTFTLSDGTTEEEFAIDLFEIADQAKLLAALNESTSLGEFSIESPDLVFTFASQEARPDARLSVEITEAATFDLLNDFVVSQLDDRTTIGEDISVLIKAADAKNLSLEGPGTVLVSDVNNAADGDFSALTTAEVLLAFLVTADASVDDPDLFQGTLGDANQTLIFVPGDETIPSDGFHVALGESSNLGSASLEVWEGVRLFAEGAQLDGVTVVGDGEVILELVTEAHDLSGIGQAVTVEGLFGALAFDAWEISSSSGSVGLNSGTGEVSLSTDSGTFGARNAQASIRFEEAGVITFDAAISNATARIELNGADRSPFEGRTSGIFSSSDRTIRVEAGDLLTFSLDGPGSFSQNAGSATFSNFEFTPRFSDLDVAVVVDENLDLSGAGLNHVGAFGLDDAELTLTLEQVAGREIVGTGSVKIIGGEYDGSLDLTGIHPDVTVTVDGQIKLTTTGANLNINMAHAHDIEVEGARVSETFYQSVNSLVVIHDDVPAESTIDLSGIEDVQLAFADASGGFSNNGAVDVPGDSTLIFNASLLSSDSSTTQRVRQETEGVDHVDSNQSNNWGFDVDGAGTVKIVNDLPDAYSSTINMRHLAETLSVAFVEADKTPADTFNIGRATLNIHAEHVDGQSIDAGRDGATIRVFGELDPDEALDLTNIGISAVENDDGEARQNLDLTINLRSNFNGKVVFDDTGLPTDPNDSGKLLRPGMELYVTAAQVRAAETALSNGPVTFDTDGTVRVAFFSANDTLVDLSGITAPEDQLIGSIENNILLASTTDLGDAAIDIFSLVTLGATLAQVDDVTVSGGGILSLVGDADALDSADPRDTTNGWDLTAVSSAIDFSGLAAVARTSATSSDANGHIKIVDGELVVDTSNGDEAIQLPELRSGQDIYIGAAQLADNEVPVFETQSASGTYRLNISGDLDSGILDLRDIGNFNRIEFFEWYRFSSSNSGNSINIGSGATIQLDLDLFLNDRISTNRKEITGDGTVELEHDGGTVTADLSKISTDLTVSLLLTQNATFNDSVSRSTDLNDATLTIGDASDTTTSNGADVRLTAKASHIDGETVTGPGSLTLTALDLTLSANLSEVDNLGDVTFDLTALDDTELATVAFEGDFGSDINKLVVNGAGKTLDITGATGLPAAITLADGASLVLKATQADALTVSGDGAVIITAIEAKQGADLSGLTPDGGVTLAIAEEVGNLTLTGKIGKADLTIDGTVARDVEPTTDQDDNITEFKVLAADTGFDTNANDTAVIGAGGFVVVTFDDGSGSPVSSVFGQDTTLAELKGTLDDDVRFPGNFTLSGNDLTFTLDDEGVDAEAELTFEFSPFRQVDVSGIVTEDFGITGDETITLGRGQQLVATEDQLDGVAVVNADPSLGGTLVIGEMQGEVTADLSEVQVVTTLGLDGNVDFKGELPSEITAIVLESGTNGAVFDATESTGSIPSLLVELDVTVKLTAAQADGVEIEGDGAVVVTKIDETRTVDLSSVVVEGGVTIDLTEDVTLEDTARIGETDLTVTGSGMLDVTAVETGNWGITAEETITVESGATLRLTAEQADGYTIEGAGNVTFTDFGDEAGTDLSEVTATGNITLERGETEDGDKLEVGLAGTDVSYIIDGDAAVAGDFILQVAGPTATGSATIRGFAAGDTEDAFDQLDFSSFSNVDGDTVFLSRSTDLTSTPISENDLVIFRSGTAESAETIEASFAVGTNSDFVDTGSVNGLLSNGGEMIFGLRTIVEEGDSFVQVVNFWHWDDTAGSTADGTVQADELTLVATLFDTQLAALTSENFILAPEV
ncbi:beta strand repeat-containing protein [Alkalilacustris brevis]|uniref:beta strand repeat-containing protein n=1 Tax=Alkalilacustris brevis TaxID=2026338 RepID=UPI0012D2B734|nr:hypothetical protein [Alkalilacustris brevis]